MDPPDSEKGGSAELEWCTTGYRTRNVQRFPRSLIVVASSKLGMAVALPPLTRPEGLYSVTVLGGLYLIVGGRCLAASAHRGAKRPSFRWIVKTMLPGRPPQLH